VEVDPGVHYLWLSNGYAKRFLRAFIETCKGARIKEIGRKPSNGGGVQR